MLKTIREIQKLKKINTKGSILVGITGRSRSGKTTFTKKLARELKRKKINTIIIHGDWYLHKTSKERKKWINESFKGNVNNYIKQINTTHWWDFERIEKDLDQLLENKKIHISPFYDVESRRRSNKKITLQSQNGVILYENAILGGKEMLKKIQQIFFLNIPDYQRLKDCISTDSSFRDTSEIVARMLLTNHGENMFFKNLFAIKKDKICFIDRYGNKVDKVKDLVDTFFPIPLQKSPPPLSSAE